MIHSLRIRMFLVVCVASAAIWAVSCNKPQSAIDPDDAGLAEDAPQVTAPVESPSVEQDAEQIADERMEGPLDSPRERVSPLVGQEAPAFELELLGGGTAKLEDHRNRDIVMVDFWATWCGPCVREMPVLAEVAAEYRGKGVVFYAVNQGEEPETVQEFLDKSKLDIAVPLDTESAVADSYGVEGIPTLVLIDKKGTVAAVHVGYHPQIGEILRQELDALLEGKDLAESSK